jgi:hypothetical protein
MTTTTTKTAPANTKPVKLPALTLDVAGAKIEIAADSYTRDGNKITVASLGKTFEVAEVSGPHRGGKMMPKFKAYSGKPDEAGGHPEAGDTVKVKQEGHPFHGKMGKIDRSDESGNAVVKFGKDLRGFHHSNLLHKITAASLGKTFEVKEVAAKKVEVTIAPVKEVAMPGRVDRRSDKERNDEIGQAHKTLAYHHKNLGQEADTAKEVRHHIKMEKYHTLQAAKYGKPIK